MPDLRTALRDAGDPAAPPSIDLDALHGRAQRLRRRRTVAATLAVALIGTGTAIAAPSLLKPGDRQVVSVAPQPSAPPTSCLIDPDGGDCIPSIEEAFAKLEPILPLRTGRGPTVLKFRAEDYRVFSVCSGGGSLRLVTEDGGEFLLEDRCNGGLFRTGHVTTEGGVREHEVRVDAGPATTYTIGITQPGSDITVKTDRTMPLAVATSDDERWRIMLEQQADGECAQLVRLGENFDPTFCGAHEREVRRQDLTTAYGGRGEDTPDSFTYGMTVPTAAAVRVELSGGRTVVQETVPSQRVPHLRFFIVRLPLPFVGVDGVTALDSSGQPVGHVDLRGENDV